MKHFSRRFSIVLVSLSLAACGGGGSSSSSGSSGSETSTSSSSGSESASSAGSSDSESQGFQLTDSTDAASAHGDHPSQIESTATLAALRLFVVEPDHGPLPGIVIKLTGADGREFYTEETDSQGYAEVLVPPGQRYELEYLALGRRSATAHVDVPEGPRQDIRLTLRYRPWHPPARPTLPPPPEVADAPTPPPPPPEAEHLVLDGVHFGSDSATLDADSGPRLDRVVEYLTHRASVRIRIEGHTDSAGNARHNQQLSEARANAVRDYLVAHGIDAGRIETVGYGGARPVAPNDTEAGRAENRRIEAIEL
jgi:outer membrane protein OmpA-like peptidoglycan-associated protein